MPVFEGGKKIGEVEIPKEFYKLVGLGDRLEVRVPKELGRGLAFDVLISAFHSLDIIEIRFTWGITTGVASIRFTGRNNYECVVPEGFTVERLAELIKGGEQAVLGFVFENARLTKGQRDIVEKEGL